MIPGSGRSAEGGHGKPTAVFIPEESLGLRSLAGYSPQGHTELELEVGRDRSKLAWHSREKEEKGLLSAPVRM